MKEGYKTFISSDGFEILVGNQGGGFRHRARGVATPQVLNGYRRRGPGPELPAAGKHFLSQVRKSAPGFPKKADPIAVHDAGDVLLAVAFFFQQAGDFLQVGYGVQVARGLFGAVAPIQIRADGGV